MFRRLVALAAMAAALCGSGPLAAKATEIQLWHAMGGARGAERFVG